MVLRYQIRDAKRKKGSLPKWEENFNHLFDSEQHKTDKHKRFLKSQARRFPIKGRDLETIKRRRSILFYLISFFSSQDPDKIHPSRANIAARFGKSLSTIGRDLKALSESGAILILDSYNPISKTENRQNSNVYRFADPFFKYSGEETAEYLECLKAHAALPERGSSLVKKHKKKLKDVLAIAAEFRVCLSRQRSQHDNAIRKECALPENPKKKPEMNKPKALPKGEECLDFHKLNEFTRQKLVGELSEALKTEREWLQTSCPKLKITEKTWSRFLRTALWNSEHVADVSVESLILFVIDIKTMIDALKSNPMRLRETTSLGRLLYAGKVIGLHKRDKRVLREDLPMAKGNTQVEKLINLSASYGLSPLDVAKTAFMDAFKGEADMYEVITEAINELRNKNGNRNYLGDIW